MQIKSPAFFLVFAALLSVPQPVPVQTSNSRYRLVRTCTPYNPHQVLVCVHISLKPPLQLWRPYVYIHINVYTYVCMVILVYNNVVYIHVNT